MTVAMEVREVAMDEVNQVGVVTDPHLPVDHQQL